MAITFDVVAENSSATDASTYQVTSSFTATSGRLYILDVTNGLSGTPPTSPTAAGVLTWTQINTTVRGNCRVTVFRGMGSGSGALNINFGGTLQGNCSWTLTEWQGVDTSNPVPQQSPANAANTSIRTTLPSPPAQGSVTYGAFFLNDFDATVSLPSGYSQVGVNDYRGSPALQHWSMQTAAPTQTVGTATVGGSSTPNWGIVGFEIKAAALSSTITPLSIESAEAFGRPTVSVTGTSLPVQFVAATQASTNNKTSITLRLPTGTQTGNVMIAVLAVNADKRVITAPNQQWNKFREDISVLGTGTPDNTHIRQVVYWKVADSADLTAGQFTWGLTDTATDCAAGLLTYANVNPGSPFDASGGKLQVNESTSASNITAPADTTSAQGDILVTTHALNPATTAAGTGSTVGPSKWDYLEVADGTTFNEVSGFCSRPAGGAYAIDDSGGWDGVYYLTETSRGKFSHRQIDIPGANNSDYEDVLLHNGHIYIHDNWRAQSDSPLAHKLYKAVEPSNPATATSTTLVATYYWDMKSGGDAENGIQGDWQHKHNCEAVFIHQGTFYAVLKQHLNDEDRSGVYRIGPIDGLSTDKQNPTLGTKIGEIAQKHLSVCSFTTDYQYLVTAAHGRMRIWKAGANAQNDVTQFLTGNATKVYEQTYTGNTEGGDWFPYGSKDVVLTSEDKYVVDFNSGVGAGGAFEFAPPAGMTERVDAVTPYATGSTARAALAIYELPGALGAGATTGTRTAVFNETGRNLGLTLLLVPASQPSSYVGPVQHVSFNGTTPPAQSPTEQPTTSLTGCMVGWWPGNGTVEGDEKIIGKQFACLRFYSEPSEWGLTTGAVERYLQKGYLILSSHKPLKKTGAWTEIRNGLQDAKIKQLAIQYKNFGKEIVFIFHHEPHDECHEVKPDSDKLNHGTAEDYREAYKKIITIFRNEGATNVKFGYCVVAGTWIEREESPPFGNASKPTLYPGDSWIDVLCHDEYNWYRNEIYGEDGNQKGTHKRDWQEFSSIFKKTLELAEFRKKPVILGEIGSDRSRDTSDDVPRSRDEWFRKMGAWIQSNPLASKWLIGFCYYSSEPPRSDWQFTRGPTYPDGVQGWKDAFVTIKATGQPQSYFLSRPRAVRANETTTNPLPEAPTETVGGTGIASEEAFGTPSIGYAGPKNVTPISVISEELFGVAIVEIAGGLQIVRFPTGSGIKTEEVFGVSVVYVADRNYKKPAVEDVNMAIAALTAPSSHIIRRVTIYEEDGETEWYTFPNIISGSVSVSADRPERRTFELVLDNIATKLNDWPGGLWYDKVIKIWRGVDYGYPFLWKLGEFVIDSIETQNFPHTVHITGRDFSKKLIQSRFRHATAFKPGTRVTDVLKAIAMNVQPDGSKGPGGIDPNRMVVANSDKVLIAGNGPNQSGGTDDDDVWFARDTDRWSAMRELAEVYGFDVFFDADGFLRVESFVDPTTTGAVLTFEVGANSNLVSYQRVARDTQLFNVVIVQGGSAADADVPYAIAENNLPNSPTSLLEIGERVITVTNSRVKTDEQAKELAKQWLPIYALEEFDVNFNSIVYPHLDVNQVIEFTNPLNTSDPTRYLLRELTIPLALEPMTSMAKRIVAVGDINA